MSKQCWTRCTWTSEFQDYPFCCEACAEYKRSRIDSETWEPPRPTCSSTRSTTKPSLQPVQSRVKEDDSGRGQHRPKNSVQSMPIILEWRHRLLHMWASLERNSGQSWFHWIYIGPSFNSRIRHQEGKTSRPQIRETTGRQRILSGQQLEKEMHKEGQPRNPWPILARSCFPWTNDWKQSRWRSLSCMGRSCRWRSHLSYVRRRILSLQEQLVDLSP